MSRDELIKEAEKNNRAALAMLKKLDRATDDMVAAIMKNNPSVHYDKALEMARDKVLPAKKETKLEITYMAMALAFGTEAEDEFPLTDALYFVNQVLALDSPEGSEWQTMLNGDTENWPAKKAELTKIYRRLREAQEMVAVLLGKGGVENA